MGCGDRGTTGPSRAWWSLAGLGLFGVTVGLIVTAWPHDADLFLGMGPRAAAPPQSGYEFRGVDQDAIVEAVAKEAGFVSFVRVLPPTTYEIEYRPRRPGVLLGQAGGFDMALMGEASPLVNGYTLESIRGWAFANNSRSAYVVGYGMDATPHVASVLFDEVKLVEIDRSVFTMEEIAPSRVPWGISVDALENVEVAVADATIDLLQYGPETFDSIIVSATDYADRRAARFWTRDFLGKAAERMRPGGTFVVNLHTGHVSLEALAVIEQTLFEVFAACAYTPAAVGEIGLTCARESADLDLVYHDPRSLEAVADANPRWHVDPVPTSVSVHEVSMVSEEPVLFRRAAAYRGVDVDGLSSNRMDRPFTARRSSQISTQAQIELQSAAMWVAFEDVWVDHMGQIAGGREAYCEEFAALHSRGTDFAMLWHKRQLPRSICPEADGIGTHAVLDRVGLDYADVRSGRLE